MGPSTVRSCADIVSILLLTVIHTGTMGWKLDNRNIMYTNQDISYECPINTMCRCASLPNETALLEINCNEVSLYKFPGHAGRFADIRVPGKACQHDCVPCVEPA
uniref:Secreted protein n=1 Tax=Anopheles culicifacies TaxID=139723 RepID=A0A182LW97_9DIPT